jgi:hypothetical protein
MKAIFLFCCVFCGNLLRNDKELIRFLVDQYDCEPFKILWSEVDFGVAPALYLNLLKLFALGRRDNIIFWLVYRCHE